ncbi:hypothetical protein M1D88_00485 [Arthrobacter sp. R1-13]
MSVLARRAIAAAAILSVVLLGPVSSANAEEFEVEVPEGEFCPGFAVLGDITVKGSEKILPGDRFWEHNVGTGVWTNAESGQTFTQRSRYALVETYDEATNDFHVTINGRFLVGFYPGEIGPAGPVTETETYSVAGHQTFTFDADTNAITAYSLDGKVLADVCAVLAG